MRGGVGMLSSQAASARFTTVSKGGSSSLSSAGKSGESGEPGKSGDMGDVGGDQQLRILMPLVVDSAREVAGDGGVRCTTSSFESITRASVSGGAHGATRPGTSGGLDANEPIDHARDHHARWTATMNAYTPERKPTRAKFREIQAVYRICAFLFY